jgi:hypothetical protein
VVDYTMLDMLVLCIFTAFEAPVDEIFYQNGDSEKWTQLRQHITEIKPKDVDKYYWKLRFLLNTICAGGAAVFNSLDHDNILMLGLKVATNATYYRIQNEQGVL